MKKFYGKKYFIMSIFIIFILLGISAVIYSYGSGVAGCTLKTHTTGCNCHSSSPNSSVSVSLSGPDTVFANSVNTFSFSVTSSGTFTKGGIDIAVSSGTLGIGTSSGIKILSGEVVHSSKFTGPTTKTFTFTAPSTPGVVTMYACGAAGSSTPPWNNSPNKTIVVITSTGINNTTTPVNFSLSQNYPNPFNPLTRIKYSVAKTSLVKLTVYDVTGNKIAVPVNQRQEAGNYAIDFDGSELSSGTYFYKIEAGDFSFVKKMFLIK